MRKVSGLFLLCLFLLATAVNAGPRPATTPRPKLILVVVFDQFRADYLTRFEKTFLPPAQGSKVGGFRYLMDKGAYFPDGEYDILQSSTCPGHSTILTGAFPYLNGIPSNFWFDRTTQARTYCAEDALYKTIGGETDAHSGTSPRALNSTTVGDELKNAGFPSKVVTVALKDRAAIMLGGHRADLALWFDEKTRHWVSSDYYLPEKTLPKWVDDLNFEVGKTEGKDVQWMTPQEIKNQNGSGMIFDESLQAGDLTAVVKTGSPASYALPYGAELTEQACEHAIDAYHLGQGSSTDLFAVSFSGHDYAGHEFGPNSREMAVLTRAEDRALSKLFNFVKSRLPLSEVTIVLTGDHGIPSHPEWLAANRVDAGRIRDESDIAQKIAGALDAKFGKPRKGSWLGYANDFSYTFNASVLQERTASLADVEAVAKEVVLKQKGVAFAFTSADYENRKLPPGLHERQILNTFYPARSADVVLIPKPYWIPGGGTADHITGYSFDRTVPILFAGFGIKPGVYARRAGVVDIAPTLSFLSGVVAPSLSEGHILTEALKASQTP